MAQGPQAIVLGGAGDVGEGIVRQLRKLDWSVIVPSRSAEKLAATEAATAGSGSFLPLEADIGSEEGAHKAAGLVRERHGPVDLVVAAIGGWWGGASLLDISVDDWYRILEGSLSAHFHAARAFLPLILAQPGGQYAFINGGAARMPVPGSGPISVAAAGQEMMQRVFAAESAGRGSSIYTLILNSLIMTRSRPESPKGSLSADDVGRKVIDLYKEPPEHGASIVISSTAEL